MVAEGVAVGAMEPRGRERRPVSREDVVAFLLAFLSLDVDDCDAFCICSTERGRERGRKEEIETRNQQRLCWHMYCFTGQQKKQKRECRNARNMSFGTPVIMDKKE